MVDQSLQKMCEIAPIDAIFCIFLSIQENINPVLYQKKITIQDRYKKTVWVWVKKYHPPLVAYVHSWFGEGGSSQIRTGGVKNFHMIFGLKKSIRGGGALSIITIVFIWLGGRGSSTGAPPPMPLDPPSTVDITLALAACRSQGQGFLGCFFQSREGRQHVFEISLFGCDLFILFIYLQDVRCDLN